jgi:hypothetical protein
VEGTITMPDGSLRPLEKAELLAPLEAALKTLSITMPVLAVALILARSG